MTALVSALVGVSAMVVVAMMFRSPMPSLETLRAASLWSWIGGLMGVAFLVRAI